MNLSSNIIRFYDVLGIEKTIDLFSEIGFKAIDFNADLEEFHTDVHGREFYKNLKSYAESKGIRFTQAHAPFCRMFEDNEDCVKKIVKAFENVSYLGTEMIVVHPCKHINYKDEEGKGMFDYNINFYKSLIPYAEEFGVKIAVENVNGTVTETAKGLLYIYESLNNPVFTICLDAGHGNIVGEDPAEMIRSAGSRIGCTHIHDNDGKIDQHTLPFHGNTDWEAVMKAFADIDYKGNFNYEASRFLKNVPDALIVQGATYMAEVGKYLIERFECYKTLA